MGREEQRGRMRGCVGVSKEVTEVFGMVRLGDEGEQGPKTLRGGFG